MTWQEKLKQDKLNYDELLLYANALSAIQWISSFSTELSALQVQKRKFHHLFEELNFILLKYIPGKPQAKWCTLTSLMYKHGLSFPMDLDIRLKQLVLLPEEGEYVAGGVLQNKLPRGDFCPAYDISVDLSIKVTMEELKKLVDDLLKFIEPVQVHMKMLVFFNLHRSVMFETYHELNMKKVVQQGEEMNLSCLSKCLSLTETLLKEMSNGSATYSKLTAEGNLDLLNLDIDGEFKLFGDFLFYHDPKVKCDAGLSDVRNMLELLQYATKYILTIHKVCKQYQLEECLTDEKLITLVELAKELCEEETRKELTLVNATEQLMLVKTLLFGEKPENNYCLELFSAVADSAPFHQFIRDKQLTGSEGYSVFIQQYQLITAQLQHEEYNEQVLNHLFAAFKFMFPFMDATQNFTQLMEKVTSLDTSSGLKQLQTVTSNIVLIQRWFSRAEVYTNSTIAVSVGALCKGFCNPISLACMKELF